MKINIEVSVKEQSGTLAFSYYSGSELVSANGDIDLTSVSEAVTLVFILAFDEFVLGGKTIYPCCLAEMDSLWICKAPEKPTGPYVGNEFIDFQNGRMSALRALRVTDRNQTKGSYQYCLRFIGFDGANANWYADDPTIKHEPN